MVEVNNFGMVILGNKILVNKVKNHDYISNAAL